MAQVSELVVKLKLDTSEFDAALARVKEDLLSLKKRKERLVTPAELLSHVDNEYTSPENS